MSRAFSALIDNPGVRGSIYVHPEEMIEFSDKTIYQFEQTRDRRLHHRLLRVILWTT
jgi:hypothetical protein